MKAPFAPCPIPESATPVTLGPSASAALPFTTKFAASVTAWAPRSRFAAFGVAAPSTMAPLFSSSAEAPMLIPFESVSPDATV